MKSIGVTLIVLGVLAIILGFFNYVPRLLVWIYNWGEGAAWGIKIGVIVVGVILYMIGNKSNDKTQQQGQS